VLSFLNAIVELVDLKEGRLVFRSNRNYAAGKEVEVRLALPPGSGKISNLRIRIESCRKLENGGLLYSAKVVGDLPMAEAKGVQVHDPSMRKAARHNVGVRVMSKQLPGYKALTIDLSRTGMQLEIDSKVPTGQTILLNLEFDRIDVPNMNVDAKIVWCRPHPTRDDRFRCGIHFEPSPAIAKQLEAVSEFFEKRSHADLQDLLEQAKLLSQNPTAPKEARKADLKLPVKDEVVKASSGPAGKSLKLNQGRTKRAGFVIPLEATIQGHRWELNGRELLLLLKSPDGGEHFLAFPECQTMRDYGCCLGLTTKGLRATSHSDLISEILERSGGSSWKHYQVLGPKDQVLLEVVSGPCRLPSDDE
jgi:Tfp pilus assembly protein PilZ